jgi:hypothetical protein
MSLDVRGKPTSGYRNHREFQRKCSKRNGDQPFGGGTKVTFIYYVSTCKAQILIQICNILQKLSFPTKAFLFQHYILTKFSCCSLKFLVHKKEKNAQKIC